MKTCTSCKKNFPNPAAFCPSCGAALNPSATAREESTLLKWLRKLGIYRSGSCAAVYHNATERPAELMMGGVFNAQEDLVTKEDFQKQPSPSKPDAP
jgi:hypothetical protein